MYYDRYAMDKQKPGEEDVGTKWIGKPPTVHIMAGPIHFHRRNLGIDFRQEKITQIQLPEEKNRPDRDSKLQDHR